MRLKQLLEERAKKQEAMKAMVEKAGTEQRTLTKDEKTDFDKLDEEIKALDDTIRAIRAVRALEEEPEETEEGEEKEKEEKRSTEEMEYRAFDAYIRDTIENRDDTNMTKSENGAVIPTSIANKIIEKVIDMCPIYKDADRYNVGGTLTIPYYDESEGDVKMDYADEFTDGESNAGKFKNISLSGYLGRAITDVSKSLINNSSFDVVSFVVNRMALAIAKFLEKELLHGTDSKIEGLSTVTQTVTTAAATAITADEVIDLQEMIPDVYQENAYFIMNKETRTAIRKLKDGQGNYLLNKDANSRWGYTLFGKDVYTSDSMDKIGGGKTTMYYGDYTGLAVKVSEDINIDVLRETKARQHAVEVLGFVEVDAKVQNAQMIAKMVQKAS